MGRTLDTRQSGNGWESMIPDNDLPLHDNFTPHDDFTPHGYLDNPYHSWKINPSGVLRSLEPLGMGWYVPNLGSYVRNQFQYTAHLTIGLKINDMVLITADDFRHYGCAISSSLHTKNRFEYTCTIPLPGYPQQEHPQLDPGHPQGDVSALRGPQGRDIPLRVSWITLTARYFLIHENALGCMVTLTTTAAVPLTVTCYAIHAHTHNPHTSRLWEHGLYARKGPGEDCAMLGIASEGDVFIHGVRADDQRGRDKSAPTGDIGYAASLDDLSRWANGKHITLPSITESRQDGWQTRAVALPCTFMVESEETVALDMGLARGVSQDEAYRRWIQVMEHIGFAQVKHRDDDGAFWQRAPQLSGDWPDTWRRGFIYDLETVRMMMRPAAGIIPQPWDGMQIQAPRTVLAEAAMDVLYLSYADPDLAAEVILNHFESSPRPNLPCMREDGSYNMVADDGQICGTAPEWGFPLWCCDQLFRRTGDIGWLRRLYPRASAYLRWWLEQRVDSEGYLVYACSWESGQDVSSRFGPQQTGGTIIEHVRPVDLQASMAQAAAIMSRWAIMLAENDAAGETGRLDFTAEAAFWESVVDAFTARTRLMWRNNWFRDYDSATGEWSTQQDAMHLAPVFCGAATREQIEQLQQALENPPAHSSGWPPLSWPPVVMTLVGAAAGAGMAEEAAELAYHYIDGSYRSMDRRETDEQGGLPGVTREYRQLIDVGKHERIYAGAGIEGYGWGALSIHLILRYLLGLQEVEARKITIAPMLPRSLRRVGAIYRAAPVQWGDYTLAIECEVRDEQSYALRLHCARGEDSLTQAQTYEWQECWGKGRTCVL
jgi:hypothetical protein